MLVYACAVGKRACTLYQASYTLIRTMPYFCHRWVRKAHPLDQPAAPLPLTDVYNSTTLIPYLENLYEEFYDDEDGAFGM